MTRVTKAEITRLAKSILASHYYAFAEDRRLPPRALPVAMVEMLWKQAGPKEQADYRWEAAQSLRTARALALAGEGEKP